MRRAAEPLASPYELAQLAVSIATMRGEKTPDIECAAQLLWESAIAIDRVVRPYRFDAEVRTCRTILKTDIPQWPASEDFPMKFNHAVALITTRRELKRNQPIVDAVLKAQPVLRKEGFPRVLANEGEFTLLLHCFAPHVRYLKAKTQGIQEDPPTRRQKRKKTGTFTVSNQGPDGKFKKAKKKV